MRILGSSQEADSTEGQERTKHCSGRIVFPVDGWPVVWYYFLVEVVGRGFPESISQLAELALDLRWTWSHEGDQFWSSVDPQIWSQTKNPWLLLQRVPLTKLEGLMQDPDFAGELGRLLETRKEHLEKPGWFNDSYPPNTLNPVAYFSMEFGLGEALPLYAGGLGLLAGDYLKTANDLHVPLVAIGLLYQEGYFRQIIDSSGWQVEAYPFNDTTMLPIRPVVAENGGWLRISVELPGRSVALRVWKGEVGSVTLYLLDSNDALNYPIDRGITNKLYDTCPEIRLAQEMILGIGGWRVLQALNIPVEVCHLNEGHAAFAIIERACSFMAQTKVSFPVALSATRAGNLFTSHTPVAAGFDTFSTELVAHHLGDYLARANIPLEEVLALGHKDPENGKEPFNMTYLAMRGSIFTNGVSRLHGKVSRRIFQPLYPRWPETEVPIAHITNGVHVPMWDSQSTDELWTKACGKERWRRGLENLSEAMEQVSDLDLWEFRTNQVENLIKYARQKLVYQLRLHSRDIERMKTAELVLDANVLTIGFARRFTAYKRPNLLLTDQGRLEAIINNPKYPVQIIASGKAHPDDDVGKRLLQEFVNFAKRPEVRRRVIFLEDYDITIAQQLVQGVDCG